MDTHTERHTGHTYSNFVSHTCVQVPVVHIPCLRVRQNESLHAPLGRLLGHVLYKTEPSFECNHALVNAHFLRESVMGLEVLEERFNEGAEFEKGVISWFSFPYVLATIVEV